jgi:hypothetical protein
MFLNLINIEVLYCPIQDSYLIFEIYVGCVMPKANAPPRILGALRYAITHPTYT